METKTGDEESKDVSKVFSPESLPEASSIHQPEPPAAVGEVPDPDEDYLDDLDGIFPCSR